MISRESIRELHERIARIPFPQPEGEDVSNHFDPEFEAKEIKRREEHVLGLGAAVQAQKEAERKADVTRPAHYGGEANPFEPIKIIEHYRLGFHIGNALKYMLRAPLKGAYLDDLSKAVWYLQREIEQAKLREGKP